MKMANRYRALCIQGKIPELLDLLKQEASSSKMAAALVKKYDNRFFQDPPRLRLVTKDPWIKAVMRIYQEYFIQVLTRHESREKSEELLIKKLGNLLGKDFTDMELLENELALEFNIRGYEFLGGTTGPFYGPYIWKQTMTETYAVEVPIQTQELTVHFMDDFIMQSWLHFASFGSVRSGGWTKEDGLYCVRSAYQKYLSTEEFTVSFLKHEAQHALDYAMFPKLKSNDLEYRAKLVELIYTSTKRFLLGLLQYADNDPKNGHVYAAYHIVKSLSQKLFGEDYVTEVNRWKDIPIEHIQSQARQLYAEHTLALQRFGSESVTGVI